jgi:uncharacterized cupin superfamily protein
MDKTGFANQLWFLDSLVTIRVSTSEGPDGISVLEHRMPYGSSPPLHLHRTEDELFHILEGEYRLKLHDQEQLVGPATIVLLPKGVPHTYRVESARGGRCLTVTVRGDFERFVRAISRQRNAGNCPSQQDYRPPMLCRR